MCCGLGATIHTCVNSAKQDSRLSPELLDRGRGSERSQKGSKVTDLWSQTLQVRVLLSKPTNMSTIVLLSYDVYPFHRCSASWRSLKLMNFNLPNNNLVCSWRRDNAPRVVVIGNGRNLKVFYISDYCPRVRF